MARKRDDFGCVRTEIGLVRVYYRNLDIDLSQEVEPGKYRVRWHEIGTLKKNRRICTAEKWDHDGEWKITRTGDTELHAPRSILPPMTAEERDAWADVVGEWAHLSVSDIAIRLPGWDDIYTFEPPRNPGRGPLPYRDRVPLWNPNEPYPAPVRDRALALAKMGLRVLAARERKTA